MEISFRFLFTKSLKILDGCCFIYGVKWVGREDLGGVRGGEEYDQVIYENF